MTAREIIIAIVSTVVGGILVWIVQQYYLNKRESRKELDQRFVKAGNSEKVITNDIFF